VERQPRLALPISPCTPRGLRGDPLRLPQYTVVIWFRKGPSSERNGSERAFGSEKAALLNKKKFIFTI
jgi:hypothetical protein